MAHAATGHHIEGNGGIAPELGGDSAPVREAGYLRLCSTERL
jgi:hypothetical protein